ncbi:NADH-quinone oxidoreductase subunit I [Candidatus Sumerlaeota bacterium]|nr:NADH-quinone oxidoreductase subunit I [Candidatus Sumerlaeota bacterium]HMZ51570.1 NADH-quinone oxidoreductase subunit I [Candidatus Sumerlaeota bacterium]HNM46960.1 NADH-quinone oxidoreductase subunit I [Candidatus Sumerlaeota bacterium]
MLIEFAKGAGIALGHMFRYLAGKGSVTLEYPEVKREQPAFFRGRHRLQRYENGLERCVGCALCAAVCPSEAIYLEAAENTPENRVSAGERYAEVYQIHLLRCIFCGFCEEACPENAIVMGSNFELSMDKRTDFIAQKTDMLDAPEKGFGTPHDYDPFISHVTPESDKEAKADPWTKTGTEH